MSGSSNDEGDSCTPSVLSGIVQDLLDNAEDTDTTKILNALDFPLWDGNHEGKTYATDIAAWDVTRGLHTFDALNPYPTGEVRWGVGGLKNTITFLHIDPDGLNTEDTIGTGGKAWGLLRERSGLKMSSIDFFLDNGFCLNEVTQDSNYDFEIIALRPGDRMYIVLSFLMYLARVNDFFLQLYATWNASFCIWNGEFNLLWRASLFYGPDATDSSRNHPLVHTGQILDEHRPSRLTPVVASYSYFLLARSNGQENFSRRYAFIYYYYSCSYYPCRSCMDPPS